MTAPDLTAITAPFGLLDEVYGPGTAQALKDSGGPWELYGKGSWDIVDDPSWFDGFTFRLAPRPAPVTRDMIMHTTGCIAEADGFAGPGWTPVRVTYVPGDMLATYRVEGRE